MLRKRKILFRISIQFIRGIPANTHLSCDASVGTVYFERSTSLGKTAKYCQHRITSPRQSTILNVSSIMTPGTRSTKKQWQRKAREVICGRDGTHMAERKVGIWEAIRLSSYEGDTSGPRRRV